MHTYFLNNVYKLVVFCELLLLITYEYFKEKALLLMLRRTFKDLVDADG